MLAKGPCPTPEAGEMGTMVLPRRHYSSEVRPEFRWFCPKNGWMTDLARRKATESSPEREHKTRIEDSMIDNDTIAAVLDMSQPHSY